MKTKIICVIVTLALIICIFINLDLVPLRREISDIEIVMVAGMDKTENGYEISFLKKVDDESSDEKKEESSSSKTQVISIEAENYNLAMRQLKTLTDKYITVNHIKYYIIGENTARTDLPHTADTLARGYQTRLNSKVYIAKGMTAKEFLEKSSNSDYSVHEKLKNMEDSFWSQRLSTKSSLTDIGSIFLTDKGEGMIATLDFKSESENIEKVDSSSGENNKSEQELFEFNGAALIKNMCLVDFLSSDDMTTANYLLVKNSVDVISVKDEESFVTFGLQNINSKIKFNFDTEDIINEMTVTVTYEANYEEVNAEETIFTLDKIEFFKQRLDSEVKKKVENIIKVELEKGIDFLKFDDTLKFNNPYKYDKNTKDIINILKKAKININVDGKIQTTYDIIESNIKQKGEGE